MTKKNLISLLSIIMISIILIVFVYLMGIKQRPPRGRDSRIVMAIITIRTVMDHIYENDGNYDNFNCYYPSHPNSMNQLCADVANNHPIKGTNPAIAIYPSSNSTAACIYSLLNAKSEGNYWYCLDSTGYAGFCDGLENDPAITCRTDGTSAYCPPGCNQE